MIGDAIQYLVSLLSKRNRLIIAYSLFGIGLLGLFVAPAYFLWVGTIESLGISFWKVQVGWAMVVIICSISIHEPSYKTENSEAKK